MEPYGPSFSEFEEIYQENMKLKETLKIMEFKISQLEKDKDKMKKNLSKARVIIIEQRNRIQVQNISSQADGFKEKLNILSASPTIVKQEQQQNQQQQQQEGNYEINMNDFISTEEDQLQQDGAKTPLKSFYSYFFQNSSNVIGNSNIGSNSSTNSSTSNSLNNSINNTPKLRYSNSFSSSFSSSPSSIEYINKIKVDSLKSKVKKYKDKKHNFKSQILKLEKDKVSLEEMNRYYKHKTEILEKTLMKPSPLLKPINQSNVLLSPRISSNHHHHCQIKVLRTPSPMLQGKSKSNIGFNLDNIIV